MTSIDRALGGDPFSIDQFRCFDAARVLSPYRAVHESHPWTGLPVASQLVFKILFVSICQQFNWDFLQAKMAHWLLPDPVRLLSTVSAVDARFIDRLLTDYEKPERIKARQRAAMLRSTAERLGQLLSDGKIDELVRAPRLDGSSRFYELMQSIPAFAEDPLEKKSRILAHDLYRERILLFEDPENLKPAVEYHIIRLYIRTGRVYPTNEAVKGELLNPDSPARPRLVTLLRSAVQEAMI